MPISPISGPGGMMPRQPPDDPLLDAIKKLKHDLEQEGPDGSDIFPDMEAISQQLAAKGNNKGNYTFKEFEALQSLELKINSHLSHYRQSLVILVEQERYDETHGLPVPPSLTQAISNMNHLINQTQDLTNQINQIVGNV